MMGATSFRSFNATTLNVEAEKHQTSGPVPIKVTKNQEYSAMDLLKDEISKVQSAVTPVCFYPRAHKKEHEKRWAGTKKDMHYSKWKLNAVAGLVRNTSLIEARSILAKADKKGADYILEVLQELEDQGVRRGINPEQMWVRTITVGSSILYKIPDIKGRGRTGVIRKPLCSMRIVMMEKSSAEFFKMMIKGNTPAGVSAIYRRTLYQNKADFEHIRASSHMLTSAGRRYRRVQFRRLVQSVKKEYMKRGVVMREAKIERNLLDKIAATYIAKQE